MDGFERRKEQNKENILKAAEALFSKYSVNKVSINDIAQKAGVSQVTIYNLFGSKDKLIQDCVQIILNRFFEGFRKISKTNKPYLKKLEDLFQYFLELQESKPGLDEFGIKNNPQFKQLIDTVYEQVHNIFMEFIKEGQSQGQLNPDLSDEVVGTYFEIFTQGMHVNPELNARMHRNPQMSHGLLLIMLYGFGKTK